MAQGNTVVAQRAIISRHYAQTKELNFAIGFSVGIACLGKMGARASVVPFGIWCESVNLCSQGKGYVGAFYLIFGVLCFSAASVVVYTRLSLVYEKDLVSTPKLEPVDSANKEATMEDFVLDEVVSSGEGGDENDENDGDDEREEREEREGKKKKRGGRWQKIWSRNNKKRGSGENLPLISSPSPSPSPSMSIGLKRIDSLRALRSMSSLDGGAAVGMGSSFSSSFEEKKILAATVEGEVEGATTDEEEDSTGDVETGTTTNKKEGKEGCWSQLSMSDSLSNLSRTFWLLAITHAMFLMVFHLFPNISGHFLSSKYGMTQSQAGYKSSLLSAFTIVGAPLAGIILDKIGGQLYICWFAATLTTFAYGLITFTNEFDPTIAILLLSLSESVIPTILMALMPLSVTRSEYGIGFGVAEVLDAVGSIGGNIMIGIIKDQTGGYRWSMIFIILLSLLSIVLVFLLIVRDVRGERILNIAWGRHNKKDRRGNAVARGMRRKSLGVKQIRRKGLLGKKQKSTNQSKIRR